MLGKNSYLSDPDSLHSHASTSIGGHEILLTHHQDLLSAHYLPPHAPPVSDPAVGYSHDGVDPPPRTAKKDRHSKIHTAQGPRDRRVRLSIGVARKFFDLQEVLGFDKPSKTLDWLLTKSRAAIKHLVSTKTSVASSLTDNNNPAEEPQLSTKKEKSSKRKKGGVKDAQQLAAMNLAKESRVKARARARERTREKMCIKQQQQQQMEIQAAVAAAGNCYHQDSMPAHNYINRPPLAFGFQFHHQGYAFPYNLTEGWDISANLASQSSFTAVLDHPKFNISYSND